MAINQGVTIHGEFSSADASALTEANSRILLYGPGSTTAITVASTDWVCITGFTVQLGASGLTVTLYDGANNTPAAGEIIFKGTLAANGFAGFTCFTPHVCQVGTWPKLLTSGAGQVDVSIRGFITSITPR